MAGEFLAEAKWDATRTTARVEKSVDLADAPDITWLRVPKKGAPRNVSGRPYAIRFSFTRHDDGPWLPSITIYAQRPESIVGDFFSPEKVADAPQWLTDLIESATPAS